MSIEKYFIEPIVERLSTDYFNDEERFEASLVRKDYDVAIFGIEECVNSVENKGCGEAPDFIRKQLYALRSNFKKLRICDLGNIRGHTARDTYAAVKDVVAELFAKEVICIILGGSQDFTRSIFRGLKEQQESINLAVIDSKVDLGKGDRDFNSHSFLSYILQDSSLRRLEIIGYQSYFVPESQLLFMQEHNQYATRLAFVRNAIRQVEPLLRDADIVSMDMSVVRQSDSPAYAYASPNGVAAEEVCQLSLFAGYSDRVKAFGVFEMNPEYDHNEQSAALAAQIVWHFIEGLNNRQKDYPIADVSTYQKYVIQQELLDDNIVFYKNPANNRWWIEIPNASGEKEIYACNVLEYEEAKYGKIPDSWMKYYKK